ncbi:hypothetical protein BSL78_05317 [Apostichopus japonicus]|uniref:C-type lectin domain-containing protein n=2 Tax=Stichopus japonicus TaxID=307972 RepID=A0A2G8LC13_STIJA|nr:hypothetical protein BSL78_05317 [Apostichopus japonicus]
MYDRLTAEPADVATMRDTCEDVGPIKFGDSGAFIGLAYLADIQSMEENDFVSEMVAGGSRAWIGAEKDVSSFYWIRDSESDKVEVSFTNWKFNEPNDKDGSEDCVEINRGPPGKWNDLLCSRKLPGVCKYNITAYTASRKD